MIFDRTLLFSNAQAITASAASTDIVDLGATGTVQFAASALQRDIGKGQQIPIDIQTVEAFNNLTSLTVAVQCATDAAFTTPVNVQSQTLLLADLTAGRVASIVVVPPGLKLRYMRIYYTVVGTAPSTGKVTAGVVAGVQTAYTTI